FQFDVGRFGVADEGLESALVDAEPVEHHLVVAGPDGRVVGMELADGTEGGLEPEAGQVEDAEGTGGAGADERNDVAHADFDRLIWFRRHVACWPRASEQTRGTA